MFLQLDLAYVDELKIHDLNDPTMVYSLRSAKRTKTPRRTTQPKSARQGTVDRTATATDRLRPLFGAALWDLAGYVDADDTAATQDAYDELVQRFMGPGQHVFRFRRLGRTEEEQVTFTIAGGPDAPSEGFAVTIRYAVTFEAADPRIFSAAIKGASYDPTESISGGGVAMPLVFPLVFSTTTSTELIVVNAGNAPTSPTFTIHGPIANPIIDNDSTGESFYVKYNLGTADVVTIDVATRETRLNGALRRDLVLLTGTPTPTTWFELQPGETALRLRGSNMAAGLTSLAVGFRDARH